MFITSERHVVWRHGPIPLFVALRLAALAMAVCSGPPASVCAAELPFNDKSYDYTVLDQDLRDTLQQFGANNKLRVVLSDAVKGRIRGRLGTLSPKAFLERLAKDFGLEWFYDGFALYVTAISEDVNRLVSAHGITPAMLDQRLRTLGIADTDFKMRLLPSQDLLAVTGPPRFVEIVQQAISPFPEDQPKPASQATPLPASGPTRIIKIYRGREEEQVSVPIR